MKAIVKFEEKFYSVEVDNLKPDLSDLYWQVNQGRWPDERHSRSYVETDHEFICFVDNDEIVTKV